MKGGGTSVYTVYGYACVCVGRGVEWRGGLVEGQICPSEQGERFLESDNFPPPMLPLVEEKGGGGGKEGEAMSTLFSLSGLSCGLSS